MNRISPTFAILFLKHEAVNKDLRSLDKARICRILHGRKLAFRRKKADGFGKADQALGLQNRQPKLRAITHLRWSATHCFLAIIDRSHPLPCLAQRIFDDG